MKQIIKVKIDKDNNILSSEVVEYKEVYIMWDIINDNIIVDSETLEVVKYEKSSQFKTYTEQRIAELTAVKKPTDAEKQELEQLQSLADSFTK